MYRSAKEALMVVGLSLATSLAVAAEGMTGANASMLASPCAGCHGTGGSSNGPSTPTIAGLSNDYLVEVLEEFASGELPSTIMGRIAKGYSEEEIKLLADYYSKQPFRRAVQPFDKALADKGAKLHDKYCEKCHADGGQSSEDDAGVLAGQWTPYLKWTLAAFNSKERDAPKKMAKKLRTLKERKGSQGITELLNYYASQQ